MTKKPDELTIGEVVQLWQKEKWGGETNWQELS